MENVVNINNQAEMDATAIKRAIESGMLNVVVNKYTKNNVFSVQFHIFGTKFLTVANCTIRKARDGHEFVGFPAHKQKDESYFNLVYTDRQISDAIVKAYYATK